MSCPPPNHIHLFHPQSFLPQHSWITYFCYKIGVFEKQSAVSPISQREKLSPSSPWLLHKGKASQWESWSYPLWDSWPWVSPSSSTASHVCVPRTALSQLHASARSVQGWDDQKPVVLVCSSGVTSLVLASLEQETGRSANLLLFWSWPATGCLTFPKSLNCSVTLCEMRMEEPVPCLSPRVTLSGKVSGDAQTEHLKARAQATLRLTRYINEADARWGLLIL